MNLLVRFFLNPGATSYLRGLEEEFGESTNAIRIELNRFEAAGLLVSRLEKNRKMFSANQSHPLFTDIHRILVKFTGIDSIINTVINNLGNIESAYIKGIMPTDPGRPSLDVFIFGEPADQNYLLTLSRKATSLINRKVTCTVLPETEESKFLAGNRDALLVWKKIKNIQNHSQNNPES
jgi:hypothetical protein